MPVRMITISSPEWTNEAFRTEWAEDGTLSHEEIAACADAQYAYLINHTGEAMRGWSYTGKGFTGPVRNDAIEIINNMIVNAVDYVVEGLAEICADVAAEAGRL